MLLERAVSAAKDDAAPIEAIIGMPQRAALTTMSQPHRPERSMAMTEGFSVLHK